MRFLIRGFLWSVGAIVLLAALAAFLLYRAAGIAPSWYVSPGSLATTQPARDAENLLIDLQTWAAARYAWDYSRSSGHQPLVKEPDGSVTFSLTQSQLNGLLQKWFTVYGQQIINGRQLKDTFQAPMVRFAPDRITIAATLPDARSRIFSMDILPGVLPDGQMNVQLLAVHAGNLPLPEYIWSEFRDRLLDALSRRAADQGGEARIDSGGGANSQCVSATCAVQASEILQHAPVFGVIFIPVLSDGMYLPVRVKSAGLADGSLTLTLAVLTPDERKDLLSRLGG